MLELGAQCLKSFAMAEKRKPITIWLLRKTSKKKNSKIEIFNARLWEDGIRYCRGCKSPKFRLRVNGKWFFIPKTGQKFFGKTEFKNIFWRSIQLK